MGPSARREYVRDLQIKYQKAEGRKERGRILGEAVENLGCHRKHAIRLLNGPAPVMERPFRQREPVYGERVIRVLETVWEATQHLWSERLKAALPLWLPWIKKRWELDDEEERQLLVMSPRTMDRRLAPYKLKTSRKIYGKTKPGRWLRNTIPIQTDSWDIREPGWTEVDTVSHSGPSAMGLFAYSVNEVDLFSGWDETVAVLGKKAEAVMGAVDEMREAMPFRQKGMDSDNGEEFINWELDRYCRSMRLKRFRSRPNKKDDQAHIEQKNWTNVRKFIGWDRYDDQQAVDAMNDLYRNELRLLCNLFLPSVKLKSKIRKGSKLIRVHDDAKTPLDRLLDSKMGDRKKLDEYRRLRKRLDPFELSKAVDKKLQRIWALASKGPIRPAPQPSKGKATWWQPRPVDDDAPEPISLPFQDLDIRRFRHDLYWDHLQGTR